jgi:hypothetical protein
LPLPSIICLVGFHAIVLVSFHESIKRAGARLHLPAQLARFAIIPPSPEGQYFFVAALCPCLLFLLRILGIIASPLVLGLLGRCSDFGRYIKYVALGHGTLSTRISAATSPSCGLRDSTTSMQGTGLLRQCQRSARQGTGSSDTCHRSISTWRCACPLPLANLPLLQSICASWYSVPFRVYRVGSCPPSALAAGQAQHLRYRFTCPPSALAAGQVPVCIVFGLHRLFWRPVLHPEYSGL